ncbi:MAG: hypothetical protein ACOX6J_06405, partial [Oscillospiraceae bacterium]
MKKTIRRIIAVLCAVSLLAVLTACGGSGTETSESSSETSTESSSETSSDNSSETSSTTSEFSEVSVSSLFDGLGMASADSYDFVCADGYTQTVPASDIAECSIVHVDGRIDAAVPGIGDETLWNIMYIVPTGLTEDTISADGGVQRIIIFEGVIESAGLTASEQKRGSDTVSDCYSFQEFADAALWTE